MNLAIATEQFDINNVFFQEAIKNTIMTDSNFIRIIYSDALMMLNGVCLEFTLPIVHVDKSFNKFKCNFDKQLNQTLIQAICKAEYDILAKCSEKNTTKIPIYRISDQLRNGVIKVINLSTPTNIQGSTHCSTTNSTTNSNSNSKKFIIKISGIWSNDLEYGLTYKFTQCGNGV
jgi:hypothetical protein